MGAPQTPRSPQQWPRSIDSTASTRTTATTACWPSGAAAPVMAGYSKSMPKARHCSIPAALLHAQSEGMFDITAGALTRLADRRHTLPDLAEIAAARACVGWRHLSWQRPQLRLDWPGMRIDLGGLVKEYAADRAAQACSELGIEAGVIELGGDVRVIGPHLDGSPWRIGIRHPRADGAIARIDMHEGGLATSGDYERALVIDGRRYSPHRRPALGLADPDLRECERARAELPRCGCGGDPGHVARCRGRRRLSARRTRPAASDGESGWGRWRQVVNGAGGALSNTQQLRAQARSCTGLPQINAGFAGASSRAMLLLVTRTHWRR